MTDFADTVETATAIDALRRKQARRTRWSRIGGAFVVVAIAIRVGTALFAPAEAKPCDAREIQTTLTELLDGAVVKGGGTAKISTINDVRTVSSGDALTRCTARIAMDDGSTGTVAYHVDPKQVTIDTLQ